MTRLAAAITEAEILTDGASNHLDGLLDTHKRFTAFRREADAARKQRVFGHEGSRRSHPADGHHKCN